MSQNLFSLSPSQPFEFYKSCTQRAHIKYPFSRIKRMGLILALICLNWGGLAAQDLTSLFSRTTININKNPMTLADQGNLDYYAYADGLPNNAVILGWNQGYTARFRVIDAAGNTVGSDLSLPNIFIVDVKTFGTSTIHLLGFEHRTKNQSISNAFSTDLELFYIRMNTKGQVLVKTSIVGGEGTGSGKDWFTFGGRNGAHIVYNGENYAVFTEISHNFANKPNDEANTHQGDLYVELNWEGHLIPEKRQWWSASHSSNIQLSVLGQDIISFTSGDGGPFGLYAINRSTKKNRVFWPEGATRSQLNEMRVQNYLATGAGTVESAFDIDGEYIGVLAATSETLPLMTRDMDWDERRPSNLLFLTLDSSLQTISKKWLTTGTANIGSALASPTKEGYMVVYAESYDIGPAKAMFIDRNNMIIAGPKTLKGSAIDNKSYSFTFSNGDFGWLAVPVDGRSIILNRISAGTVPPSTSASMRTKIDP